MKDLGFVRVAVAIPRVHVGDPFRNIVEISELRNSAFKEGAQVIVFPELCLTGYTCRDLFLQPELQTAAIEALGTLINMDDPGETVTVIGLPLRVDDQLFNVAVVYQSGKILAVIPKTFIPNYKEFEEGRWFRPATSLQSREITLCGQRVPIGTDIIIDVQNDSGGVSDFRLGVEICEDLWMPIPPSSRQALAGATVLVNLSASNALVGKASYRRDLVVQQSARCIAAYLYVSAGTHESTADVVFDGHAMIAENGVPLGESQRYKRDKMLTIVDVDVQRLVRERTLTGSFGQAVGNESQPYRLVPAIMSALDVARGGLRREIDPHPFVPSDGAKRDERCEEIFSIQIAGLARRLEDVEAKTSKREVAIGLSGGLDSTLALLATVRMFDFLGWDRKDIHPFTLPGFGTTARTKGNAHRLAEIFGLEMREASIVKATKEILRAEGHNPRRGCQCIKCENAQARVRTAILMTHGFVIGTGDLSEAALGWCTFNGDHMSMYNVNAGIPKTLVRHVVGWVTERNFFGDDASAILRDIIATPISPELLPAGKGGKIVQRTEDIIGPYELHDFFLFHFLRNGAGPEKIFFLAERAFAGRYDKVAIYKWLKLFFKRFFFAQFKRDAVPNGPKVGSVALSPRGDWRMPSDIAGELWIERVNQLDF